jgi:hypothetical protein
MFLLSLQYIFFSIYLEVENKNPLKTRGLTWQRPTLPGCDHPSTIGAEELNFRVRDGNGCDLFAIITRYKEGLFLQN